jgi:hypothetical protein
MLPRALTSLVLCAAATWPLRALACGNSMDYPTIISGQTFGLDLILWTVGAVFLNSVVLVNVRDPAAEGEPSPSRFRRSFFLIVGTCLVLLFAVVSAGGLLLSLSAIDLSRCTLNRSMLLMLVASPTFFFVLQTVLIQGVGKRWLGDKWGVGALVGLVVTAVVLSTVVDLIRQSIVLDRCGIEIEVDRY